MAFLSSITFSQAKSRIARAIGGQGDAAVLGAAGEALTMAISEWNMKRDWNWALTPAADIPTVIGTQDYVLPTNVKKIYEVHIGNPPRSLAFIDEREYKRSRWDQTIRGLPIWYTSIYAGTPLTSYIRLYPIPASVIAVTVRYFRNLAAPTLDADTLDIPAIYENGLLWLAKALFLADRDAENARTGFWQQKADHIMTKAIEQDDREPDRETRLIPAAEHMRGAYDPTHPYYYLGDEI